VPGFGTAFAMPTDATAVSSGRYSMLAEFANLQRILGTSGTLPTRGVVQADLQTTGRAQILASMTWPTSIAGQPLEVDLRVNADGATGAVIRRTVSSVELLGPFFIDISGVDSQSGFALDGSTPTNLLEAFDTSGNVTHTTGTQGSYDPPSSFVGWPGDSSTWTTALGQGRSTNFTTVLGGLPAVSAWFDN
jgi:hypothetical protein